MILVTGATGTVGSEVVRQLVAVGDRPRAFVRDPDGAHRRFGEQAELVAGDLDRPETLEAGLAGVDRVFLITTQSTRQLDWEGDVIAAAARAGVRHVVKVSVFRADEHSPPIRSSGRSSSCRTSSAWCAIARSTPRRPTGGSRWWTPGMWQRSRWRR